MAHEHLSRGLHCFAAGDLEGAARAWLEGLEHEPHDVQLRHFVDALRVIDATLVAPPMPFLHSKGSADIEPWGGPSLSEPTTVHSDGPGLGAVSTPGPAAARRAVSAQEFTQLQQRLKELLDLHDFSNALEVADKLLRVAPGYATALRARHMCRERLQKMYESKIGAMDTVPSRTLRPEELPWLDLDQRSGFVLSQVDGVSTYAEILEISGLDTIETLRIIAKLVTERVIGAS